MGYNSEKLGMLFLLFKTKKQTSKKPFQGVKKINKKFYILNYALS